jgi:hypothetical protein
MEGKLEILETTDIEIPDWIVGAIALSVVGLIVLWVWWRKSR